MDERLKSLESAVAAIEATVARMEDRIGNLEVAEADNPELPLERPETGSDVNLASDIHGPVTAIMGSLALVGRSMLVLAGAFLLRALTENGTFAPMAGVAAGVVYAAVWVIASAMAASRGARASAGFYAVCSALIVGPLLLEASTTFDVISPATSLVTLAVMTGCGLLVATRWRFQSTAWVFSVGGVVTSAALATMRPPGELATAFIVLLGLAVFWLAEERGWGFLKIVTALAADLAVLRLTAIATATNTRAETFGPLHPSFVAIVQASLAVGFVGMVVIKALRGKRPLTIFDFVQTALVWLVGWGGAVQLAKAQNWGIGAISVVAVGVGLAAYFGAFGVVDRRQGRNRAFLYLSSLGLGLVLIGLPGVIGVASARVWSIVAVVVAAVGSRWDRVTLRVHALLLLIAAWVVSGLADQVAARFGGGGELGWGLPLATTLVAFLTVVTTVVVLVGRRLRSSGWAQCLPLTGMLLMSGMVLSSAISFAIGALMPGEIAMVAETVALSGITVSFALLGTRWGIAEAGWLVYPFLLATGLRMIATDLSSGRTLVLVIALTAYGAALIVSTRLLRTVKIRP